MYFFGKRCCVSLDEIVDGNYKRARLEENLQDRYAVERKLRNEQERVNSSIRRIADLNAQLKTLKKTDVIYGMRGI